jgi:non-lysosomal glucosylceramidase
LVGKYRELLKEKGIIDQRGLEIEGHLGEIINKAGVLARENRRPDETLTQATVRNALKLLNYSETNLGNFPQCAFDRPIGYKLENYGHQKVSYPMIDGTAEGNGAPVGGIGAGSFERTISGNFRFWFLKQGQEVDDIVRADQFHLFVEQGGRKIVKTLSSDHPRDPKELSAWKWDLPNGSGKYYALFPKSGFSYEDDPDLPVKLAVTQFSPIIANDYKETSYPVAVYKWIAENPSDKPAKVSVMFTFENMTGWQPVARDKKHPEDLKWDRNSQGDDNQIVKAGNITGVVLRKTNADIRSGNDMTGEFCIAACGVPGSVSVSYVSDFDPASSGSGPMLKFSETGELDNSVGCGPINKGERSAAAIAVSLTLDARQRIEFPIVLSWDLPFAEFAKGVKYQKKYTQFYGAEGNNSFRIAKDGLNNYKDWEGQIDKWQKPVIEDRTKPDWFKQALFNELYLLPETGIWDAKTDRFTYLEGIDYKMYGTFDVDSYGSWHLLKLWPELEKGNLSFFAGTVDLFDPTSRAYGYAASNLSKIPLSKQYYYWSAIKETGMIPHDLGAPSGMDGRPWTTLNAYDWQNPNVWKDLNPKFPLRAFRDFIYTGGNDKEFLRKCFDASVKLMDTLEKRYGNPGDHIPRNEGIPDQTYDTWPMEGKSAYVGFLWLAALKATIKMAGTLCEWKQAMKYEGWLKKGEKSIDSLWNEKGYFNVYQDSSGKVKDDVMADQLFGIWYAKLLGIEGGLTSDEKIKKTLNTIYQKNVVGFGNGVMGAVNGRTTDGTTLGTEQGNEVWTGTTYSLASNMISHGMREEGLQAAYGEYYVVYGPYGQGYYFKTPEAYVDPKEPDHEDPKKPYGIKDFRASKYMRPGAIWAVNASLK